MTDAPLPVVFIHGLWLHATSWTPWLEVFGAAGHDASAPGWPGIPDTVEAARANPQAIAGHGIDDVARHYAAILDALPQRAIVIGHSFGGLMAQKLLGDDHAAAAIAIDPAPIKGVLRLPLSTLKVTFPVLSNPANRRRAFSLSSGQFRYGFANTVSAGESDELHATWTIPAPCRPLFEAAAANLAPRSPARIDTGNATRGPLLLIGGGRDHTVPASLTRATHKLYRHTSAVTEYKEFPDRGHSLIIDTGWRGVADACLSWLRSRGLSPR